MPAPTNVLGDLSRLARKQPWLDPLIQFLNELRIDSKERPPDDERGAILELWNSQRKYLELLATGLSQNIHEFLYLKSRQLGLCLDPSTRVLTADLRWIAISELKIGDEIVSVDEHPLTKGKGSARKMRVGTVTGTIIAERPAYRLIFDDGRQVVCTGQHPWLYKRGSDSITRWGVIHRRPGFKRLKLGDQVRWITKPWGDPSFEDGWFAGILDGEGSMGKNHQGGGISVSQRPGSVWDRAVAYAQQRGYSYRIEDYDAERPSKFGKNPVFKLCFGRMDEIFRLIGQTRPTRFIDRRFWEGRELPGKRNGGVGWSTLVKIEILGDRPMVDLQTSHGTYIAEGFVSHNTTISVCFDLFWLAIHPRTIGCLVVDDPKNLAVFRQNIRTIVNSFPKGFFGKSFKVTKHNDALLQFSNGSRLDYLVAGKRSTTWGEGRGYSLCHLSEVSKYGNREGLENFLQSFAVNNPERVMIMESTANGMNHWRDMWYEAKNNPSIMCAFIGWWARDDQKIARRDPLFRHYSAPPNGEESALCNEVLERYGHIVTMEQLAWYRSMQAKFDKTATDQNQPWVESQAFVLTGYSFFNTRLVQNRYTEIYDEEIRFKAYRFIIGNNFWATVIEPITDPNRLDEVELRVWEEPNPNGTYVIGCDPAYGHSENSDNHAVSVWRCYADKIVQVAEYADNRVQTHQAAWVLAYLAGAYKNCMVNLELGGPGRQVMREFDNIKSQLRSELYQPRNRDRGWEDFLTQARWFLYTRPDQPGNGYVFNFEMSYRNKFDVMNLMRDLVSTDVALINSVPLIEEMATMVQERSDIGPAASGHQNDDRVIAAALAFRTYYDWIQKTLVAAGATYDAVLREELGMRDAGAQIVDRLVINYFKRIDEQEEDAPPWMSGRDEDGDWKRERGLL